MTNVIYAIVILGGLAIVFGLVLGIASKVFAVEVDEREEAITGVLPGANCGGCGYAGCGGYAAAVVKGKAPINACAPGGAAVAEQIGEIMGIKAEMGARKIAQVLCTGGGYDKTRYDYVGLNSCLAISRVSSGPLECSYGCLGGGDCVEACKFDAIHIINNVAKVDFDDCVACGACVTACPKHIIQMVPLNAKKYTELPCSSHDKGPITRHACDNGCIGCKLCVKACPKEGAIVVEDFLAKINYDICIGCGLCSRACPRKLITIDGKVLPPKPKKPAEPAKTDAAPAAAPVEAPKAEPVAPAEDAPKTDA